MTYMAYYKKPNGLFWHKIKNIEGDTVYEDRKGNSQPVRIFHLKDKRRLEIPMTFFIKFSKERFYSIKESMEKEASQEIKTK